MRNPTPLIATLLLCALSLFLILRTEHKKMSSQPATADIHTPSDHSSPGPSPDETAPAQPSAAIALSLLAETPDWSALDIYQNTISRIDFERLLTEIFTTDDTWKSYIAINDDKAEILTSNDPAEPSFILNFSTPDTQIPVPRHWQSTDSLPIPPPEKPLQNLHIAIDPGHIGGEWAKIEERWFRIGTDKPVMEGEMSLHVANLLKPMLEALGARVSLVRKSTDPVTTLRPENLASLATAETTGDDPESLRKFAEKLFYRTAEIRARAELVNKTLKPDLVLCLHFNAAGWGDPTLPTLVPDTHFHVLLNGAYTSDEVNLSDQRFAMLEKLLQRTHEEEALVGNTVANTFAEISKLPAYVYPPLGNNVRPVAGNPFLYARNLLANRLYDCPVIYMEPYVMNSVHDYARIQAGDYHGLREVNGEMLPSIFQEYASALAEGLAKHYARSQ